MIVRAGEIFARHAITAFVVWLGMAFGFFISFLLLPVFGFFSMLLALIAYILVANFWFERVHGKQQMAERGLRILYMFWTLVKINLLLAVPFALIIPLAFANLFFVAPHMMQDGASLGIFMLNILQISLWVLLLTPLWMWIYLRLSLAFVVSGLDGPMKLRDSWKQTRQYSFALIASALLMAGMVMVSFLISLFGGAFISYSLCGLLLLGLNSALYLAVNGSAGQRG